jgi:upstream activation factor subunit UAF30
LPASGSYAQTKKIHRAARPLTQELNMKKARSTASSKRTAMPKTSAKRAPAGGSRGKRRVNPALTQPVQPDRALSAVVGKDPLSRPQLIKKLWAYIKSEGLQDSKDRRTINADDALRPVFGGKRRVNMFDMTKLVNEHIQ